MGSLVLENYGWRTTFQMIGVLTLAWVYYYRNYVLLRSRAKQTILNAKDDEPLLLNPSNLNATPPSPSPTMSVPWMEILNKLSFWSLIFAHVCQNNAYYILLTWLPTYFEENYPGSKVILSLKKLISCF